MRKEEVERIFKEKRESFFADIPSDPKPLAVLLGGQPACGKSTLLIRVQLENPTKKFLSVNGDLYRTYHPDAEALKQDPERYSPETQLFSSVFTEGLIDEAIRRKTNIIIEGTMRNPSVPLSTAQKLREAGYRVEAYAICAPKEYTRLGIYIRYAEEIATQGWGRLAEEWAHDAAVEGVPKTLDILLKQKAVDAIHLFTYLSKEKVALFESSQFYPYLPSEIVSTSRQEQLSKKSALYSLIDRAEAFVQEIQDRSIRDRVFQITEDYLNPAKGIGASSKISSLSPSEGPKSAQEATYRQSEHNHQEQAFGLARGPEKTTEKGEERSKGRGRR